MTSRPETALLHEKRAVVLVPSVFGLGFFVALLHESGVRVLN